MGAVRRIADKEALYSLMQCDPFARIRFEAAKTLGDYRVIADIAKDVADDEWLFKNAIASISDAGLLKDIALAQTNIDFALYVLGKITNVSMLRDIRAQRAASKIANAITERLRGFVCVKCGHDNTDDPAYTEICICVKCGYENHDFKRHSNVTEHRDCESGSRWDECTRCGKKKNYESIFTM